MGLLILVGVSKYKEYWEKRSRNSLRHSMEKENRKTAAELNKLTNKNIKAPAEKVSVIIKLIKWCNKGRGT